MAHVVRIDLQELGIGVVVTVPQPSDSGDVFADKTSGFVAQHGVQLAINTNYFYPCTSTLRQTSASPDGSAWWPPTLASPLALLSSNSA